MSRLFHMTGAAALAVGLLCGGALPGAWRVAAQSASPVETPAAVQEIVSLEGSVRETFLNRFILDAGGSRLLVEPSGRAGVFSLTTDEKVTVTGRRMGTLMQAARIVRANGEVIYDSSSAPPAALESPQATSPPEAVRPQVTGRSIPDVLAGLGLQPLGEAVRKRHHIEILARMSDGRSVYVSFDLSGRLWEIEDADYDRDRVMQQTQLSQSELFRHATAAGFSPVAVAERKKHHAVVTARNRSGEVVELHIDFAGYIYKQVWPR
jgi:hypothetical protein